MAMKSPTSSIPILPRNVQLESEDILWTTQLCRGHSLKQVCYHQYVLHARSSLELIIWSCQQEKKQSYLLNNFSGGKSDDSASARGWVFLEGAGARLQRTRVIK